ncbi:MAG: valine--tRNA ligase [Candidatus Moranbacteria bacterium]|jgi:valyl-tRNA synthetase|nr:valine--tRNA ligase [Candidatus Moranbacteria bacterium]
MTAKELPAIYEPKKVEDKIYKIWEESGFFNPDNLNLPSDAKSYTIVLPPPNITAKLHLGHSAMLAIGDLMIRFRRMRGYRALWIPGTDHAAIATQNVVEKKIFNESGLTRHALGKEEFLKKVWEFLKETQTTILHQTRKMGSSLDWSREAFTLDDQRKKAVTQMFVDMYEAGVIYQGERIVNWCPRCQSTLADDEVEHQHQETKLYTFRYWKDFPIAISTTRPETKLGDTAVAVNPKDERYKKFIGQEFEGNFCGINLKIKIIADREVEMDFGTGALGVTPAHSMIDWKMAENNNLNIIKVIDESGKIHPGFGKYSTLSVFEARALIITDLKEENLIEKEENIVNNLSICYRCDTAIEPLPSKQWFVAVDKPVEKLSNKSLKEKAIEVATNQEIKFVPDRFTKIYLNWMENLHDWCISRQIWFGHSIPAYYCKCGEAIVSKERPKKCPTCDSTDLTQDEDSLDTWFSSGMWTFSTLGWPENFKDNHKSGDLKRFHPTQMLETGHEILTLWVSRMIMMSLFAIGEIPFENVYLHGMIVDKDGKKMSKSKGNGIDPLDMIEKFGTDAVRLSLLMGSTPGNDMRLSEEKIENYRNFVNKLWNISRFVISKTAEADINNNIEEKNLTFADKWIISKMENLIIGVTADLEKYSFSLAGEKLQEFTKNDFADWYLEVAKFEGNLAEKNIILGKILKDLLKLWHPFIPFVTEEIWTKLNADKLLLIENWPTAEDWNKIIAKDNNTDSDVFEKTQLIITAIRNLRAENKIEPTKKLKTIIYAGDDFEQIKDAEILIKNLRTSVGELIIEKSGEKPAEALYTIVGGIEIYLINEIDKIAEQKRIMGELENLKKYTSGLEQRLSNKEFIKKAPAQIVAQENEKLLQAKTNISEMEKYLEKLI